MSNQVYSNDVTPYPVTANVVSTNVSCINLFGQSTGCNTLFINNPSNLSTGKVLSWDLGTSNVGYIDFDPTDYITPTSVNTLTNKVIDSAVNTISVNSVNVNSLINQDVRSSANPSFQSLQIVAGTGQLVISKPDVGTSQLLCTGTGVKYLLTGSYDVVGDSLTQTLTNKTLTLPTISSINNGGTITIPSGAGTIATLAATQTLTNKSVSFPTSGGTPAILNYYETGSFTVTYSNAGSATPTWNFVRVGNVVTLQCNQTTMTFSSNAIIDGSGIPSRFVSTGQTYFPIVTYDNGTLQTSPGVLQLLTGGAFRILKIVGAGGARNFTGPGVIGHEAFNVTFIL